eukprot:211753_1
MNPQSNTRQNMFCLPCLVNNYHTCVSMDTDISTQQCRQCKSYVQVIKYLRQRVEELHLEQHYLRGALKLTENLLRRSGSRIRTEANRATDAGSINEPTVSKENDCNELRSTANSTTNNNCRYIAPLQTPPEDENIVVQSAERKAMFDATVAQSPSNLIESTGPNISDAESRTNTHIHEISVDATGPTLSLEHCPSIENCSVLLKLKQKLHAFQQTNSESASNVSLLNDFLHLSQHHHRNEQFQFIRKELRNRFERQESESKNTAMDHTLSKIRRYYHGSIQKDRIANRYYAIQSRVETKSVTSLINENSPSEGSTSFCFGYTFRYAGQDRYRARTFHPMHSGSTLTETDTYCWIKAKYKTFKDELMNNNDLATLNPQQFDSEYKKAMDLLNTFHCKKKYNGIDVQNILSVCIYCNFDDLQRTFSKTYRVNIKQHEQFYHLGLYLRAAVHQFGTEMCSGKVKQFYHGIGQQLTFPQIGYIQINCPLSTSSSRESATHFANFNSGLIVEFGSGWSGRTKYFPTEWVSDFPQERECLFVQCRHTIKINNITHAKTGTDCSAILEALNVIERVTSGHMVKDISKPTETMIENIIDHQLAPKSIFNKRSFEIYQKHLINTCFSNKSKITMNFSEEKNKVFEELFHSTCDWINLQWMTQLFPHLEEISINDICLCSKIFDSVIVHLRACLGSNIRMIVIKPTVNSNLRAELTSAIGTYKTQLNVFNFDIFQQNKHFDQVCIQRLKPLNETITSRHRQKCQTMRTPLSSHALLKPAGKITQIYPHLRL